MKILLLTLILSISAQARQYIQCAPSNSNSSNRAIINLNGNKSTLFMTSGLLPNRDTQPEIRVVKDLFFKNCISSNCFYSTKGSVVETVKIPTSVIDTYSNYFQVEITHQRDSQSSTVKMSCFSSIYNE